MKILFFQTTKLRLWRLERQRKCLVWQKRYLQAVLQSMDHEGNAAAGHSPCKNNSCCNCTTSSSEGHSMSFEKQENQESRKRPTTKFRQAIIYLKRGTELLLAWLIAKSHF